MAAGRPQEPTQFRRAIVGHQICRRGHRLAAPHVFAGAGATLSGVCHGVLVNMLNAFITAGSGRLVDVP
jgi:hypothetical protein